MACKNGYFISRILFMTSIADGISDKYELVVGLEVHAQLSTLSKSFSSDSAAFGGGPNEHISPVSLATPALCHVSTKKWLNMR